MALIHCPRCGHEISDKAAACVHCGYVPPQHECYACPECGRTVRVTEDFCPYCGCPNPVRAETGASEKPEKKKLHPLKIIFTLFILASLVSLAYHGSELFTLYGQKNYYETANQMIAARNVSVEPVNRCYHLLISVWANAIWEKNDPETDPFVCPGGVFVSDFNDALDALYADPDFQADLTVIYTQQAELRRLRNQLGDPPKDLAEYHRILTRYIDVHIEISVLLLEPYGSFNELSDRLSELFDEDHQLHLELDYWEF